MRFQVLSLLTLAVVLLAEFANAKTIAYPWPKPGCCKKGQFCCGSRCLPSWKQRFVKCAFVKDGCCKPPGDPCKEKPFQSGFCKARIPRYSFNPRTKQCELFYFGGCGGNANNFNSKADCIKKCDAKPPANCCEPGEKCCGNACIPKNAQTSAPCGEPTCCKPKPCICTKEFAPVCNRKTNKQYGNKCEAKCAGEDEDDLTEGECPELCACTAELAPVCNKKTGKQYDNKSCAICAGEDPDDLTPGKCPKQCICTLEFAPVCFVPELKEFSNKCFAACDGFTEDQLTKGPCPKDPPPKPDGCCPKDKPVCCGDGCITKKQSLVRLCPAKGLCGCEPDPKPDGCCKGKKPVCCGDICITKEFAKRARCKAPGLCGCPKPKPDCICPAVFKPVCSKSTGKQYGNGCEAGCANDPGPFTDGPCPDSECCKKKLPCCVTTH